MWQPSATIETLKRKALILQQIRNFFNQKGYLEVETPIMAHHGVTDVYLSNIQANFRGQNYSLQTSPEYHMKRLLAAGSGPIFQIARVFRDDEWGRWHNPEFSLLEWYQLDIDHHDLMDEMNLFLTTILDCPALIKKTYQQAFIDSCGLDPFDTSIALLKQTLAEYALGDVLPSDETDFDQYFFLLMSHVVEPFFGKESAPVAIYDFPATQAALARVNAKGRAERFEIYYQGVELANGFHELTDPQAQALRFEQDLIQRKKLGLELTKPDHFLLSALKQGLPACSGVALGVDRLMALALNQAGIGQTLAFEFSRA
jgi:lysyl-tRNA synthetase class 2